ncbi:MoaB/Mog domain-containing protein [Abortiporus biennis]|nr:MoaB/Mog domain-containing protein [Abortiporus biennis]
MSPIQVAILTVSDTASKDATADKSGPTIKDILVQSGFKCKHTSIVSDDVPEIHNTVLGWCAEEGVDLILTTGGTGFGVRDKTPEAISSLIERPAPGLVHLLLSSSLQRTPYAALSRPIAGTFKNTLIITLPGSVKAVKENLEALLADNILGHAVDLIRGGTGKGFHSHLAQLPQHHHHYHEHSTSHGHNTPKPRSSSPLSQDPSSNVPGRQRVSPYPMVSVKDALIMILQEITPLPVQELDVTSKLRGCVLAEDIHSPSNIPPIQTSNVDGYAVRSTYKPGIYTVLTTPTTSLPPNDNRVVCRVNTGGPVPSGADAVLMVEDTRVHSTAVDLQGKVDEKEIETLAQVNEGENLRQPGSDVKEGDLVLEKGTVLVSAGGEIGTLAFVGRKKVKVHPKPIVGILSTGNELKDLHGAESGATIWDTNRPSLQAILEGIGYEVVDLGIVPDDLNSHVSAIKRGLASTDILITTGGTSMGTSDLLKPVIERELHGTIHFGRVNVKPGKPTTFGIIPTPGGRNETTPIFALPGNPASALVMFHIFVVPALRRLNGRKKEDCHLPRVKVKLQEGMRLDPRPEYHRVTIVSEHDGLKAYSTGGQRSSRVASLSGANGLVALPALKEGGPDRLHVDEVAEAVVIGELQMKL